MLRCLICLATLLLSISAAWAQPAQCILIRHAEKPEVGDELSLAGRERAAALVPYFLGEPALLKHGRPVAIYAQKPNPQMQSVRAVQTVQPLADALGLKVQATFTREDYKAMVKEIMESPDYQGQTVVICWEHKVIPLIAHQLGAAGAPDEWPRKAYDRTWLITFTANQPPQFEELAQRLMFGDSKQ